MRLVRDRLLWTPTRKEPLAQGRRGPDMTRNSTSLLLLVAATLFLSSAFPSPAAAQTVSFVTRVDYAVGANPSSVAVGDCNGDGRPAMFPRTSRCCWAMPMAPSRRHRASRLRAVIL